jgi:hypothetical protein
MGWRKILLYVADVTSQRVLLEWTKVTEELDGYNTVYSGSYLRLFLWNKICPTSASNRVYGTINTYQIFGEIYRSNICKRFTPYNHRFGGKIFVETQPAGYRYVTNIWERDTVPYIRAVKYHTLKFLYLLFGATCWPELQAALPSILL